MNEQERYEKQKKMYLTFKRILERISKQDIVGQALADSLTIHQIEVMRSYVQEAEDMGFEFVTQERILN